jgi:hypothetical protein
LKGKKAKGQLFFDHLGWLAVVECLSYLNDIVIYIHFLPTVSEVGLRHWLIRSATILAVSAGLERSNPRLQEDISQDLATPRPGLRHSIVSMTFSVT